MDDAQPEASALFYGSDKPKNAQNSRQESGQKGPLIQKWRQLIRRQDDTSTDDDESTEAKSETQESTKDEGKTTEDKITTTEDKPTTTDKPTSTTEESTTQATSTEQSSSLSTVSSTETSSEPTSTSSSTITSMEQGASCYSTTVSTSVVCHITTGGHTESASCITNRMTSSTCAPGLLCEIHPSSGGTVCMKKHGEIGTEGIVVASVFAVCIAGCIAVLAGMCIRDKRAAKKFENLKRAKTLRAAKREQQVSLLADNAI